MMIILFLGYVTLYSLLVAPFVACVITIISIVRRLKSKKQSKLVEATNNEKE